MAKKRGEKSTTMSTPFAHGYSGPHKGMGKRKKKHGGKKRR